MAVTAAVAHLRLSPSGSRIPSDLPLLPSTPSIRLPVPLRPKFSARDLPAYGAGGINGGNSGTNGRGGGGGGGGDDKSRSSRDPLSLFIDGWRSRVEADPQFPFKVLMEELVGVSACVLGDMASRPNFGLNELDFVFSTLVVGSILNFVLMYLLAPTSASATVVSSALPSYMFEPGPYSVVARAATVLSKGALFAAVGFAAGLAGTALSNGLIAARKKMDPAFETPNKPPPTVLNALTWAIHMGVSSNLRYQTLNGIEYMLAKALPPAGFKFSVVGLRCINNVLGGVSFVALARLTGSQKDTSAAKEKIVDEKVELLEKRAATDSTEPKSEAI